jgi:hypothetical protein
VADAPVPPPAPVAIRITRPYATEDEYLEKELETLSRAGITLLGAQSRPQGVVLRFELVLASGLVLIRGEGRVIGFKVNAFEGVAGLSLRFTRLDTRSKALIDKAAALREQRRPSTRPPTRTSGGPPPLPPLPAPPAPAAEPPLESAPSIAVASEPSLPLASPSGPELVAPTSAQAPESAQAPAPADAAAPASAPAKASAFAPGPAPVERDSLLERLRSRAKALDAGDVQRILSMRRRA